MNKVQLEIPIKTPRKKNEVVLSGITKKDRNGKDVPVEMIRPEHLVKDAAVEKINKIAANLQAMMIRDKKKIYKEITRYQKYLNKLNGITEDTSLESFQFMNYSGTVRIMVKNQDICEFDENLQAAEIKIKNCIKNWGEGAHPFVQQIVNKIFRTDKKGFVNKVLLLSLLTYKIEDTEWKEAMQLIVSSMHDVAKKEYLNIQYRNEPNGEWENFNLNFSSISIVDEKGN